MGVIYLGLDVQSGQQVAVKAVRVDQIADPDEQAQALQSIRTEAALLLRLSHPNIVHVLDFFDVDGYPHIVMEFIDGLTLARLLNREVSGVLPLTQATRVIGQICSALKYLHQQTPPIVFRDLKPENVMLDSGLNVKLIDFGIARTYKAGKANDTTLLGSRGFAAPEQYGFRQTDARSDIYSLGIMYHHMLTGFDPSRNPLAPPPPVRMLNTSIPTPVEAAILRATQRLPESRWQSIEDFEGALYAVSQTTAPPILPPVANRHGLPPTLPIDFSSPTTRLLLKLNRFSDRQLAIGFGLCTTLLAVFTFVFGPMLFPFLRFAPLLSFVPAFMHALVPRRWVAVAAMAACSVPVTFGLFLAMFGSGFALSRLPWIGLGAVCGGLASEFITRIMARLKPPETRPPAWKPELMTACLVGVGVFVLFYPFAWGTSSVLSEIGSWLAAPLLGALGWFVGDAARQFNMVRQIARHDAIGN